MLECGAQVTGGYFCDPGFKDVPDPWDLAFPIAEVESGLGATAVLVNNVGWNGKAEFFLNLTPDRRQKAFLKNADDHDRHIEPCRLAKTKRIKRAAATVNGVVQHRQRR